MTAPWQTETDPGNGYPHTWVMGWGWTFQGSYHTLAAIASHPICAPKFQNWSTFLNWWKLHIEKEPLEYHTHGKASDTLSQVLHEWFEIHEEISISDAVSLSNLTRVVPCIVCPCMQLVYMNNKRNRQRWWYRGIQECRDTICGTSPPGVLAYTATARLTGSVWLPCWQQSLAIIPKLWKQQYEESWAEIGKF